MLQARCGAGTSSSALKKCRIPIGRRGRRWMNLIFICRGVLGRFGLRDESLALCLLALGFGLEGFPFRTWDVACKWIEQVSFCVPLFNLVADTDRFWPDAIRAQLLRQPEFRDFLALAGIDDAQAGKIVPGPVGESIEPVHKITRGDSVGLRDSDCIVHVD